jgi:ferrochelatase
VKDKKNTGLILLNLGSPDSAGVADVRRYLNEFLMDERVIDVPYLLRFILVKGVIVPLRAPNSARAYQTIWTKEGSPLKVISRRFKENLQSKLDIPVSLAMRYGSPGPVAAYRDLIQHASGLKTILLAPMYPHYAMSSYETAVEHITAYIKSTGSTATLKILQPFYKDPIYIEAMATGMRPYLNKEKSDAYLFSYHGLPVRHLKKSDPTKKHCYASGDCCEAPSIAWDTCYKHQVKVTTKLIAEKLNLDPAKVHLTFQSRLAGDKWLQPYTDIALAELPKSGAKKLLVLCPAFVADCLETLEEMDDRGKEIFMNNGGEVFTRVPCLNINTEWVNAVASYCEEYDGAHEALWR